MRIDTLSRGGRGGSWIAAVGVLSLLGCIHVSDAAATTKCRYNPVTHILSATATVKGSSLEEPELRRVGTRIVVGEFLGPQAKCQGSPTVTNTDQIKLRARGFAEWTIKLAGGQFAPGASLESDSSPEIEIILLGKFGTYFLEGENGPDHFRYMTSAGQSGVNLNAAAGDEDIDLSVQSPEAELFVDGRGGGDTIDVVGHPNVEVAVFGGGGNDVLNGGGGGGEFGGSLLDGGAGRDRIIGSSQSDLILPGAGADIVEARGGSDQVKMRVDGRRDRIDCGSGRDGVSHVALFHSHGRTTDPVDRLRSCEHVERNRRH